MNGFRRVVALSGLSCKATNMLIRNCTFLTQSLDSTAQDLLSLINLTRPPGNGTRSDMNFFPVSVLLLCFKFLAAVATLLLDQLVLSNFLTSSRQCCQLVAVFLCHTNNDERSFRP